MYYRGAAAAILVYDICKKSSFQTLQKWVEELRCNGPSNIALIVCGNKTDLAAKYRQVETSTGKIYAESIGATFFEARWVSILIPQSMSTNLYSISI